jgi:hypothetical protein
MPTGGNFGSCPGCGGGSNEPACSEQLFTQVGCDDTNGDGIADVQFVQLWAVPTCTPDATARLVATYEEGDFSAPYTPVNPVDCSGLVDGAAGTSPITSVGLCLADGTPIAVTVQRDCDGVVTSEGWINLTTGGFTPGAPPAGAVACGGGQSIQVAGVFCDVLGDGTVAGLVLVEYQYAADGSIESVRLVDAATGETYTLSGELSVCPAGGTGAEGVEVEQQPLCVIDNLSGAVLQAIIGEFRYDVATGNLLGVQYVDRATGLPVALPGGTRIDVCPDAADEPCRNSTSTLLCDEVTNVTWAQVSVEQDPAQPENQGFIYTLSPVDDPSIVATISVQTSIPPNTGVCDQGDGSLFWASGAVFTYQLDENARTLIETLRVNLPDLDSSERVVMLDGMPDRLGGNAYTNGDGVIRSNEDNATGYMYFDGPPATLEYQFQGSCLSLSFDAVSVRPVQFLRTFVTDCETGAVVSTSDTTLDGEPYTVEGDIGACAVSGGGSGGGGPVDQPCRDSSSTLLCDITELMRITVFDPVNVAGADGWQVVSFDTPNAATNGPIAALPYDAAHPAGESRLGARPDLAAGPNAGGWSGYDTAPIRWVLRKTFDAPEDGVATVESTAFRGDGGARVRVNGVDAGMYGQWDQPATSGTAQIPVTAGPNTVEIEVRDVGGPNYVTGRLDVVMAATNQFLRAIVTDCETGAVVAVSDTTLDGDPYEVTGTVGQCQAQACCDTPQCASSVQILRLCDLNPDVEPDEDGKRCATPFLRQLVFGCDGTLTAVRNTTLAGDEYTPIKVVDCECASGSGSAALVEIPWNTVSVVEDPATAPAHQDFIFTVSPENDPSIVGTVHVHVSTPAGGACGAFDINNLVFSNAATYTLTLDEVAQQMSYLRVDLMDFDTFEPVTGFNPRPDRIGGTAVWDGNTLRASESNGTGLMYWDNPPASLTYRINNTGGGTSCSQLSFQGMTLEASGCCGCGCAGADPADGEVVRTGIRHVVNSTDPIDLTALHPRLQSATLLVVGGTVQVTTDDGVQPFAAATLALTWSVQKDTDDNLGTLAFEGSADCNYIVNFTYLD